MLKFDYKIDSEGRLSPTGQLVIKDAIIKIVGISPIRRTGDDWWVHPMIRIYPNIELALQNLGDIKPKMDLPSFMFPTDKFNEISIIPELYSCLTTCDEFKDAVRIDAVRDN